MQRENIEMYLKGCQSLGLKNQDLFQVNDLYENKNLYMVVDNICTVGGMVSITFSIVSDKRTLAIKKRPGFYVGRHTRTRCSFYLLSSAFSIGLKCPTPLISVN